MGVSLPRYRGCRRDTYTTRGTTQDTTVIEKPWRVETRPQSLNVCGPHFYNFYNSLSEFRHGGVVIFHNGHSKLGSSPMPRTCEVMVCRKGSVLRDSHTHTILSDPLRRNTQEGRGY